MVFAPVFFGPQQPKRPHGVTSMLPDHDHRQLAQRLDLFHFQEEAPGMAFWHKNGLILHRILEQRARELFLRQGYEEVRTPLLVRRPLWEVSGHWQHFAEGMFKFTDQSEQAALKPVNCPGHVQLLQRRVISYRDLPVRLAEFGCVHRDEPAGALHGLLRLRQFTQDDGHIFCTEAQAALEIAAFCHSVRPFYAAFGFDTIQVALSTRPQQRVGSDEFWDRAEATLREALEMLGLPFDIVEGGGAFYGPKIEFSLRDKQGRHWQCGTIQFDFFMPERFGLHYVAETGKREPLVMLHRALYGSLERFLGVLLEHYGAALPLWLAPLQILVIPIGPAQAPAAKELACKLREAGLRCELDERDENLSQKLADAHQRTVPYQVILGSRELLGGNISLRGNGKQRVLPLLECVPELSRLSAAPELS